jgi:HEAT repeat protein
MNHIAELIRQIERDDRMTAIAADELIRAGKEAVAEIIEAIKEKPGATHVLCNVLRSMQDPDIVPILASHLRDPNSAVALTAFQIVGNSRDPSAFLPLMRELAGPNAQLAIEALGDFGDPRAVPSLLQRANGIIGDEKFASVLKGVASQDQAGVYDDPLSVVPALVVALAKLGNFAVTSTLIPLTRYYCIDPYSSDDVIRANAVQALQHVVLPGMLAILTDSLSDKNAECRLHAVDAIFYLGTKKAIAALAKCQRDESSIVSKQVLLRLRDLTGREFGGEASVAETQEWFRQSAADYEDVTCYRLGKPLYMPNVIDLLGDSQQRSAVLDELEIVSAAGLGKPYWRRFMPGSKLSQDARTWWECSREKFVQGGLYKYGRRQRIEAV